MARAPSFALLQQSSKSEMPYAVFVDTALGDLIGMTDFLLGGCWRSKTAETQFFLQRLTILSPFTGCLDYILLLFRPA